MGGDSKRKRLAAIRQRYSEVSKEKKGLILQEFREIALRRLARKPLTPE